MISPEILLKKKQKQKKLTLLFLFIFFLIIGIFISVFSYQKNQENYLDLGVAKRGHIVEAVYGLGTVTSENTYQLKLGVSGKIGSLYVKEGQKVKKGDRLLSLAGEMTFYAPFSGTVTSLPYHLGEFIFPQIPILTLTDLIHNYVLVSLEQESALKVKPKQNAIMNFEGQRQQKIEGTVTAVYPKEAQFYVRIDTQNFPQNILPGMTVDVAIKISEKDNALLIPASGVQSNQKVLVLRHHKKINIPVKTGFIENGYTEITAGDIQPGEHILLRKN